ncbi:hypothetical protein KM043_016840 [Ampulex compressa]|nr:hypothetical protein KM043_016840 [Ampulex compressa]
MIRARGTARLELLTGVPASIYDRVDKLSSSGSADSSNEERKGGGKGRGEAEEGRRSEAESGKNGLLFFLPSPSSSLFPPLLFLPRGGRGMQMTRKGQRSADGAGGARGPSRRAKKRGRRGKVEERKRSTGAGRRMEEERSRFR